MIGDKQLADSWPIDRNNLIDIVHCKVQQFPQCVSFIVVSVVWGWPMWGGGGNVRMLIAALHQAVAHHSAPQLMGTMAPGLCLVL